MKIVLVEDNGDLQKVYAEGLRLRGLQVSVAANYDAAMKLAKETEPDVILLDLLMPKVNGMDVLRTLKSTEQLKDIPVIVLTNIDNPYFSNQADELGVVGFYIKSDITLDRLAAVIKAIPT